MILGQEVKAFLAHALTMGTFNSTNRQLKVNPKLTAIQVSNSPWRLVVEGPAGLAARSTDRSLTSPFESNQPGFRIAKESFESAQDPKAGEAVSVRQPFESLHPES